MKKENKFLSLDDSDFFWNSILMFNEFNKDSSAGVLAKIVSAAKDNKKDINLFINSYGGIVDDLLTMIDMINLVENDVATIGLGCCASCGAVLLASGTKGKRFMTENARVMIHQVSAWAVGKNSDLQIRAKEVDRLNKQLASILAKATGKSKKQILEDFKEDKWFTAQEALDYGLIDKILKPEDIRDVPELKKKNLDKNTEKNFVFKYELKSFEEDEENYTLKGIASTPDVDLCKDIIEQKALINSVEKYGLPKFLHLHKQDEQPLGAIKNVVLEDGNVCIEAIMPKNDKNKEIANLIKINSYGGLSIGYSALKSHFKKDGYHGNIRVITEIMWHETSLVALPCNPNAKLQEFKNKGLKKNIFKNLKSLKELEEVLKDKGFSNKETLTCISKIKELTLNKDTAPTSDLSDKTPIVSDLQFSEQENKQLKNFTNTINNILGKYNG